MRPFAHETQKRLKLSQFTTSTVVKFAFVADLSLSSKGNLEKRFINEE